MPLPHHTRRATPALLLLAFAAACGPGASPSGVLARDSAGIAIVSSTAQAVREAPVWRLSDTAQVEIGGVDARPGEELHRVAGAAWLPDGRVVIANAGTGQLRFHAADGRLLASAGRTGGGPGEFRAMQWMAVGAGDSVLVYDPPQGRISVFDAAGNIARTFRLEGDGDPLLLAPAGLFADGTLLVRGIRSMTAPGAGTVRDSATYLRFARNGAPLDTLATLPHGMRRVTQEGDMRVVLDAPLAPGASVAVDGPGVWYASGGAPQVDRLSPRGVLVRSVRWDAGDLRLSAAEAERFRRERTEAADPRRRPAVARAMADAPLPDAVPAISGLVAGADGELWVRPHPRPGQDSVTWLVLREDGRIRARVPLPTRTRVLDVARDSVLVVEPDADDVERVRSRAIRRP